LNPDVLALAKKVSYHVDPSYPGPGRFKGSVRVTLNDGRVIEELEEYNRGSAENPMSDEELRAKFDDNASDHLSGAERDALANTIDQIEHARAASVVLDQAVRS